MAPPRRPVWNGFTQDQLDAAYNNAAAVTGSPAIVADWVERSARFRASHPGFSTLRYGPRERNVIDIFPCGRPGAPLFVFIHGGYWQRNQRETFSILAQGPLAAGMDVAMPGYTLAPEATLTQIVAETEAALGALHREGPGRGMAIGPVVVSGWSAGAHLAAMMLPRDLADAALLISGVYDLEPIRRSYLDDRLKLGEEEIGPLSPQRIPAGRPVPVTVTFGGRELPELQRHSRDYAAKLQADAFPVTLRPLARDNHFSILDGLIDPGGALTQMTRDLVGACRR